MLTLEVVRRERVLAERAEALARPVAPIAAALGARVEHLVRARAAVPDHAAADLRAEEEVGAEVDHLEGLLHRVRPVALDLERLARLELRLARREPPRLRRHRVRVLREGARRREHEPGVDVRGDLPVAAGVVHVQRLARAAEVGQQEARPAVHRLRRADPLAVEEAEGVGRALGTEGDEERCVHGDVDLALLVREDLRHLERVIRCCRCKFPSAARREVS